MIQYQFWPNYNLCKKDRSNRTRRTIVSMCRSMCWDTNGHHRWVSVAHLLAHIWSSACMPLCPTLLRSSCSSCPIFNWVTHTYTHTPLFHVTHRCLSRAFTRFGSDERELIWYATHMIMLRSDFIYESNFAYTGSSGHELDRWWCLQRRAGGYRPFDSTDSFSVERVNSRSPARPLTWLSTEQT